MVKYLVASSAEGRLMRKFLVKSSESLVVTEAGTHNNDHDFFVATGLQVQPLPYSWQLCFDVAFAQFWQVSF